MSEAKKKKNVNMSSKIPWNKMLSLSLKEKKKEYVVSLI